MTLGKDRALVAAAAEIAVHSLEISTGTLQSILIIDTNNEVAQELDRDLARALAVRLIDLSAALPDHHRTVRRASDVDDNLRLLDDE